MIPAKAAPGSTATARPLAASNSGAAIAARTGSSSAAPYTIDYINGTTTELYNLSSGELAAR